MIHICNFSTKVSELTRRQKKSLPHVLRAIMDDVRINTWEMGEHGLWRTVKKLVDAGFIIEQDEPYPYHRYKMTDAGYKYLEDNNHVS